VVHVIFPLAQADGFVFKIVPMEGTLAVNGEQQKLAGEILAETEITLILSQLRGSLGTSFERPAA
jgi:hypothetical protein